jgi:NAD(P)-dependent dehydrogenase (short-subunit alcohol dehydrogenase family)
MKNVLVTGANKGIGYEVARQLVAQGYYVFLGCRDQQKGKQAAAKIQEELNLSHCEALTLDVADLASVKNAATNLAIKVDALDILINNAGIAGPQPQKISECDIAIVKEIYDTNIFGALQTTQQLLPLMRKSEQPVIVNVSSELGSLTVQTSEGRKPNWDLYHIYGSTKTALNGLTVAFANEFKGSKFRINCVTPGFTATDFNNFSGTKTAADGAKPIVRLATIGLDGPNGEFFGEEGQIPW